jgi:hypothetical protein
LRHWHAARPSMSHLGEDPELVVAELRMAVVFGEHEGWIIILLHILSFARCSAVQPSYLLSCSFVKTTAIRGTWPPRWCTRHLSLHAPKIRMCYAVPCIALSCPIRLLFVMSCRVFVQ